MNDLPSKLRKYYVNGKEWYGIEIDVLTEAADHIEAQEKLIDAMREALQQALTHIEADECTHGRNFAAGNVARSALSNSNPNTPERNDE